jgi:predicted amidohydrolase
MKTVGFYQFYPRFGRVEENLTRVVSALRSRRADIIVLPELAFTGYFFKDRQETFALAEDPKDSPTLNRLITLCREQEFYLVTGFAEREGHKVYNSAFLIGPEGLVHTYRKLHLFNTEKRCFDPGNLPLRVTEIRGMRVGMMVCFDWAFPEVARALALQGADLLCHPSNLVLAYCQQAMITRSLENAVFAVTANRFGVDQRSHGDLTFTGQSQITAPDGSVLYRSGPNTEDLHLTEIDIEKAKNKNITSLNHILNDRRPEFYGGFQE